MASNKYVAVGFVVVFCAVIGLGGYEFWKYAHKNGQPGPGLASLQVGQTDSTDTNGQNIPLSPASSGLSTDSSPSTGLGQLSVGGSNGASSSEQGLPSSGSSSGGSSSSSSPVDPSTFGQYAKYAGTDPTTGKPYASALFGDVQVGTGAAVANGSQVAVYYKGWLTNGTLFDQSRAGSGGQLQPFSFTEGQHQVIPGWEEGLYGMKAGGTRLLVIPPSLGYGASGQGSIPGNAVLVFEVQLLSVN